MVLDSLLLSVIVAVEDWLREPACCGQCQTIFVGAIAISFYTWLTVRFDINGRAQPDGWYSTGGIRLAVTISVREDNVGRTRSE